MEIDNNIRIFLVDDDSFCMNVYKQYLTALTTMNRNKLSRTDKLFELCKKPNGT